MLRIVKEIFNILVAHLGMPPKNFEFSDPRRNDDKVENITPLEYTKKINISLDDYVRFSHLPFAPLDVELVKTFKNVVESSEMKSYNVDIEEIKKAIRNSIKGGQGVSVLTDLSALNAQNKVMDQNTDDIGKILSFEDGSNISKKNMMLHNIIHPAHIMYIIGCDDETVTNRTHYWKLKNSWEKLPELYVSDDHFTLYSYAYVIKKKYLTKKLKDLVEQAPRYELDPLDPAW